MHLAKGFSIAKPICPERVRIHEGVTFQEQVGDQLAHGGGLQESVAGESRRVQEISGSVGSADQGIVIGRVLVEPSPARLQSHAYERRGDDGSGLVECREPLI